MLEALADGSAAAPAPVIRALHAEVDPLFRAGGHVIGLTSPCLNGRPETPLLRRDHIL
jgi:hypothetical protein